ncbi:MULTISPECIES: N-acetylmuramidase family protein [unclassified Acinetobacter]|uniref:N-acetylmuramidase family protein n=1 Tax=unclassified Acinetobacter TaxID=196816 RepID=UPI0035BB589D
MSKILSLQQINNAAKNLNVPVATLRAVIEVEARGAGFDSEDKPVILFERHVFYQRLTQKNLLTIRNKANKERPDLCFPNWTTGSYGSFSAQHKRLEDASAYHRETALESCSWGLGQVMGYHWKTLSYPSLQSFINAMFKDEAGQLDAMCRFIKVNRLDGYMRNLDWAGFALGYNGSGYKANRYDEKLAAAYRKFNTTTTTSTTSTTTTSKATTATTTKTTTTTKK